MAREEWGVQKLAYAEREDGNYLPILDEFSLSRGNSYWRDVPMVRDWKETSNQFKECSKAANGMHAKNVVLRPKKLEQWIWLIVSKRECRYGMLYWGGWGGGRRGTLSFIYFTLKPLGNDPLLYGRWGDQLQGPHLLAFSRLQHSSTDLSPATWIYRLLSFI